MKIYTSYFAKVKELDRRGIRQIAISMKVPDFFKGPRITEVAPCEDMLHGRISNEEYVRRYNDILLKVSVGDLVVKIAELSEGNDVALLCYERPEKFCHRHLLARYMGEHGVKVREYQFDDGEGPVSNALF